LGRAPSIRLVPLQCPRCGDDIGIGPHDRVFLCRRCLSLWEGQEGKLVPREAVWAAGTDTSPFFIPFWVFSMTADTPGGKIADVHSYLRHIAFLEFAKARENRPLSLYVVAAALTVERFRLSISRRFTYLQPAVGQGAPTRGVICGPCLDEKEAARYARVIFISTLSEAYKGSAAFLRGLRLTLRTPRLTLIPFGRREKNYIDPTGSVIIPQRLIEDTPRELVP
jgi:hypothetical protein